MKKPTNIQLSEKQEESHLAHQDQEQKPCIIVVHASVGSGHKSAAEAVAEAFTKDIRYKDFEIIVCDILDYGKIYFDGNKLASSFTGATRPVYDITWRYLFTGRILWGGGTVWSHLMFNKFTDFIAQHSVKAIVATHIAGANAAAAARMVLNASFPIVSVPTDYETEGWWPHEEIDSFCVANESMAETLRARNIPEDHIVITGIPTRIDFCKEYDCHVVREEYHLPQNKRIVLLLAGASLPQPYKRFRNIFEKMFPYLKSFEDVFHFVVICGKDSDYATELKKQAYETNTSNISILGYVSKMAALMQASDLVICKSGGLTVTECLCAKVPMLLLGHSYGQEKINVRMLTSFGSAMHVTTAREAIDRLRYFSRNPQCFETMLINATGLRKPHAAEDIIDTTFNLIQKTIDHPPYFSRQKHFINFYIGQTPAHVR